MRLSGNTFTIASGPWVGGLPPVVQLANMAAPIFGPVFLHGMSSVYPGFPGSGTVHSVRLGASFGLIDDALAVYSSDNYNIRSHGHDRERLP